MNALDADPDAAAASDDDDDDDDEDDCYLNDALPLAELDENNALNSAAVR